MYRNTVSQLWRSTCTVPQTTNGVINGVVVILSVNQILISFLVSEFKNAFKLTICQAVCAAGVFFIFISGDVWD